GQNRRLLGSVFSGISVPDQEWKENSRVWFSHPPYFRPRIVSKYRQEFTAMSSMTFRYRAVEKGGLRICGDPDRLANAASEGPALSPWYSGSRMELICRQA